MSSIFISYSHADRSFVTRLIDDLRFLGAKVWFDQSEIMVGDSLIERIRRGIDDMEYVGAVISRHSVKSAWVQRELDVAMNQEIDGKRVKVLPVVLDDVEMPGFLKGKLFADFRNPTQYELGLASLALKLRLDQDAPPVPLESLGLEARARAEICNRLGMMILSTDMGNLQIRQITSSLEYWDRQRRIANDSLTYSWDSLDNELYENSTKAMAEAQRELHRIQSTISGPGIALREAARLFRESARLGDTEGMWNLGWRYALGEGVQKDAAKALLWWRRAAERGHVRAHRKLLEQPPEGTQL